MDVADFLRRAADRAGFKRESYVEANTPTQTDLVTVLPLFGDMRGLAIASAIVLPRYRELLRGRYLVLATYPGWRLMFPGVDEYWSVRDGGSATALARGAEGPRCNADLDANYRRVLHEYFADVPGWDDIGLYDDGLTTHYRQMYPEVRYFLPGVPSSTCLPDDFRIEMGRRSAPKVLICPTRRMDAWQLGRLSPVMAHRDFWCHLVRRLLGAGYVPVVHQNAFTYDISAEFADRCIWLATPDVGQVLSAMRWCDCVLDVHSGLSRLATAARSPCLVVDERRRYIEGGGHELDAVTNVSPRHYVFSFAGLLSAGSPGEWDVSLLDGVISRLNKWLPTLDRATFPAAGEVHGVSSYEPLRQHRAKRLGVRLIRKH